MFFRDTEKSGGGGGGGGGGVFVKKIFIIVVVTYHAPCIIILQRLLHEVSPKINKIRTKNLICEICDQNKQM